MDEGPGVVVVVWTEDVDVDAAAAAAAVVVVAGGSRGSEVAPQGAPPKARVETTGASLPPAHVNACMSGLRFAAAACKRRAHDSSYELLYRSFLCTVYSFALCSTFSC